MDYLVRKGFAMDSPSSAPAGWYADPRAPDGGTQRWWDGDSWTSHTSVDETVVSTGSTPIRELHSPGAPTLVKPPDFGLRLASHVLEVLTVILAVFTISVALIVLGSLIALTTLIIEIVIVVRRKRRGELTITTVIGHLWVGAAGVIWFAFVWIHGIVVFLGH